MRFHYHPGDAVTVVAQGELTVRSRCRPDRHFSAGQAFVEVADVVHQVGNEGTEPVIFYRTIVGPGLGPVGFVDPPNCAISASLQPSVLGFGDQTMLTSRTRRLTLRNTGTAALPIVSVDVSGRDEETSHPRMIGHLGSGRSELSRLHHLQSRCCLRATSPPSCELKRETILFSQGVPTGRGVRAR